MDSQCTLSGDEIHEADRGASMRHTVPLQAVQETNSRGTIFDTDTVAAISCVPPVRPSLAISVKLKANEGKS